jgi:alpha-beta hydrolase superfamily lysophospholipase
MFSSSCPFKNSLKASLFFFAITLLSPFSTYAQTQGKEVSIKASDGQKIYGTFTKPSLETDKILLLFHQAGANRHEYDPLISKFTKAGFAVLAIDQRSGGTRWDHTNKTVKKRGSSGSYSEAYADLKGALAYAEGKNYKIIIAVGSSYSAALAIVLASENPTKIDAVAAFSPGEYLNDKNRVKSAAAKVQQAFYITAEPERGEKRVDEVLSKASGKNIIRYQAKNGVHGASTLIKSRNPNGYAQNLKRFLGFLENVK